MDFLPSQVLFQISIRSLVSAVYYIVLSFWTHQSSENKAFDHNFWGNWESFEHEAANFLLSTHSMHVRYSNNDEAYAWEH